MKTARFMFAFAVLFMGLLVVRSVSASAVKSLVLDMSDPRPSLSSDHTFTFTTTTADSGYQTISVMYCVGPTYGGTCLRPAGFGLTAVTGGDLSSVSGLNAQWTLANNEDDTNEIVLSRPVAGQSLVAGTVVTFTVNGVTNPSIGGSGCTASSNNSTGTCYIHLGAYSGVSSSATLIDSGVASLTVVSAVTVTARVDPTFTFVVDGVASSAENNGVTTSVSSAYNTLPFGNLTAGTPKYAAHRLTVTTNTQSGYTVAIKMVSQMTGVYAANNIDAFVPVGAQSVWTQPTAETPNTNTGWIGWNTTDNEVANWEDADSAEFSGVSELAESTVMRATGTDNGSVSDYVSYALEVNVFQPADSYTGTLYYNAFPTY